VSADRVAFLFLGETLLMPHLYPVVPALAAAAPGVPVDLWVSTDAHEALLTRWLAADGIGGDGVGAGVAIRRAPGFRRDAGDPAVASPRLPAKLPMLARLLPRLWRTSVAVCVEQTSLWLPALTPVPTRFVQLLHGTGPRLPGGRRRRDAAYRTLVPARGERDALAAIGADAARIVPVGYVKPEFRHRTLTRPAFAEPLPVLLYTPHWQRGESSWWPWGREVVARVLACGRFNLVFAPHQRLADEAPDVRALAAELAGHPRAHADVGGFACVDNSYTDAADIYVGDASSQAIEFMRRPRPCVFLNARGGDWRNHPPYAYWRGGPVAEGPDALLAAVDRAVAEREHWAAAQREIVAEMVGDVDGGAAERAAREILAVLEEAR